MKLAIGFSIELSTIESGQTIVIYVEIWIFLIMKIFQKEPYYSEILIAGERDEYFRHHSRFIDEIRNAINNNNNAYLLELLDDCLEHFER